MDKDLPRQVDTVIIGNGPSALILSYILHGHIPTYDHSSPHPDHLLHEKLKPYKDLLDIDVDHLTGHFGASRFSYSTQALPANVLLDTLIRPLGETDDAESKTCLKWHYDPTRAVPHIVVGNTLSSGGQWADNPVKASWDIGTLSYAGMLSLPGYSFVEHYATRHGKPMPFYLRPSRREVADYFASYPEKVGISDAMHNGVTLSGIRREGLGFRIGSHDMSCDHLILASGTFTSLIRPRSLLRPLQHLPEPLQSPSKHPILVVGSGFSAADVIISTPSSQKIIHIFKWAPSSSPSPLRACHQRAYPEYAGVYRKMKLAAITASKQSKQTKDGQSRARRGSSSTFDLSRDWDESYKGLPNTEVIGVQLELDGRSAIVTLQNEFDAPFQCRVSSLAYVVGRRGSLSYIDPELRHEVCPSLDSTSSISGRNLRDQANEDLEIANNVFIAGSLTGDTLIRFAYGGCVYAAGKIMQRNLAKKNSVPELQSKFNCMCKQTLSKTGTCRGSSHGSRNPSNYVDSMHGFDGHQFPEKLAPGLVGSDLVSKDRIGLDRRKTTV